MTPVLRSLLAFCLMFFVLPQAASAGPYESTAPNAILIDYKSGRVLYEKNADIAIPPAEPAARSRATTSAPLVCSCL